MAVWEAQRAMMAAFTSGSPCPELAAAASLGGAGGAWGGGAWGGLGGGGAGLGLGLPPGLEYGGGAQLGYGAGQNGYGYGHPLGGLGQALPPAQVSWGGGR